LKNYWLVSKVSLYHLKDEIRKGNPAENKREKENPVLLISNLDGILPHTDNKIALSLKEGTRRIRKLS